MYIQPTHSPPPVTVTAAVVHLCTQAGCVGATQATLRETYVTPAPCTRDPTTNTWNAAVCAPRAGPAVALPGTPTAPKAGGVAGYALWQYYRASPCNASTALYGYGSSRVAQLGVCEQTGVAPPSSAVVTGTRLPGARGVTQFSRTNYPNSVNCTGPVSFPDSDPLSNANTSQVSPSLTPR